MTDGSFAAMRIEYGDTPLDRVDLPADPLALFAQWLAAARAAGVSEPNGMALATCDADGQPQLLELELTEPSLFFATAPGAAERRVRP